MPRTKSAKKAKPKCKRDDTEEIIKNFERKMEDSLLAMDNLEAQFKATLDTKVNSLKLVMSNELKEIKMHQFQQVIGHLSRFSDFKASDYNRKMGLNTPYRQRLRTKGHPLTDDSGVGRSIGLGLGPLHSARARSACNEPCVHTQTIQASNRRFSRKRVRTPMATRMRSFSADRSLSPSTSPLAFLRYPKPGEIALSKRGSPMVTQIMTDSFANVNIPMQNGVLCVTSKKLVDGELNKDLLKSLNEEKLNEIKVLHANLQKIVHAASQAGVK